MKAVLALCLQDFKRLMYNSLFWIISVTLILIILVVNLALPKSLNNGTYNIISYNIPNYEEFTAVAKSEEDLKEKVGNENSIGFIGHEDGSITVVHTGLSEKTIKGIMLSLTGQGEPIEIKSIYENGETVPYNKRMTPLFISFEALIVGFILGGTLMLSEKQEATVKLLRISPVSINRYIISKVLLFSVIGTVYALLMAVFCVSIKFNYLQFIVLSILGSAVFSLMGLMFTTLFRDMSGWFFSASLLLALNMGAGISYSNPSFNPSWMSLIPSYPIIFSYEAILFGRGMNWLSIGIILIWCTTLYILCFIMIKKMFYMRGR